SSALQEGRYGRADLRGSEDDDMDYFENKQKEIEGDVPGCWRSLFAAKRLVWRWRGGGGDTRVGCAGSSTAEEANSVTQEAEKVRGEDEINKGKVGSKSGLEKCCFTMRDTVNEEKLREGLEAFDKEKEEFENKQKEIEGVLLPMVRKRYQAAGGAGIPQGGLYGGGRGATSEGGAGISAVEEANSLAREVEEFRTEDETNEGKVERRNGLEKCCFAVSDTMNEEKLRDEFEAVDRVKDEFENKRKESEGDGHHILRKGHQAAGAVCLRQGGLTGCGGGATRDGGDEDSIVEEANGMAREAEEVRGEGEEDRRKVESRNGLEKCHFTMRNTVNAEKFEEVFEAGDEEKDEYESRQKETEGAAGGAGVPQGGLSGGCAGAADAGGFGSSTVKEANSEAREAEKVKNEDETSKGKIESRNGSVRCCLTMRNTMNEEKLRGKFEAIVVAMQLETGLAFCQRLNVQVRGGRAELADAVVCPCAAGLW
ncbi:unnamed protein product, partial [Polarella glacialis]